MQALRLTAWKSEPVLVEVEEPVPGPGQVVIRVGGAGACHSDLHLMHDFDGETNHRQTLRQILRRKRDACQITKPVVTDIHKSC